MRLLSLRIGAMDMVGEECVGFLFDGELPKARKTVEICGRSIHFLSIDDDPGHVQVIARFSNDGNDICNA